MTSLHELAREQQKMNTETNITWTEGYPKEEGDWVILIKTRCGLLPELVNYNDVRRMSMSRVRNIAYCFKVPDFELLENFVQIVDKQ